MSLPGLVGVEHVGLTVPDLDAAERFLVGVLGAAMVFDGGAIADEDTMTRVLGARTGDATRYRFYRLGTGLNLEVFEYRTSDDPGRHPGNHQAGGHHLALYVEDVEAAAAHLRAHGVAVDPPETIAEGPRALGPADGAGELPGRQGLRAGRGRPALAPRATPRVTPSVTP